MVIIEKNYLLKISNPKIKPSVCSKWYFYFFNRAIVNAKCPIEIDIKNVGDDFPGGFLKISLNPYHRVLVKGCVVKFDDYKLDNIKKGDVYKIRSSIICIGSCDKNVNVGIRIYSDNTLVKFQSNLKNLEDEDRVYCAFIQTSTCPELDNYVLSIVSTVIAIIGLTFAFIGSDQIFVHINRFITWFSALFH